MSDLDVSAVLLSVAGAAVFIAFYQLGALYGKREVERRKAARPVVLKAGRVPYILVGHCDTCGAISGYTPTQVGPFIYAECAQPGCNGSTEPVPPESNEGRKLYDGLDA